MTGSSIKPVIGSLFNEDFKGVYQYIAFMTSVLCVFNNKFDYLPLSNLLTLKHFLHDRAENFQVAKLTRNPLIVLLKLKWFSMKDA